ncbi:MAG: chorismate--pyruvate lyase [Gammaproteobacteria bacterium]|jgi:chorismate lyase
MDIQWNKANLFGGMSLTGDLRACLLDTGSLIKHLEKFSPEKISLSLEAQSWKKPYPDESKILNLRSGGSCLLRETFLTCNAQPWVYARTIIPPRTLLGSRRLAYWGNKPLGYYLFADKLTYRGKIEIAKLKTSTIPYPPIYNLAIEEDNVLWGRRSIFYIKEKPLLLTEIFLPEAIKCILSLKQ